MLRGLTTFYVMRADYDTARDMGRQLLDIAQAADPPDAGDCLESHLMLGITDFFSGEFTAARDHLRLSTELYDPNKHHNHASVYGIDPGVLGLSMSAVSSWSLGHTEQAMTRADKSLALAEATAHPYSTTQCRSIVAFLHLLCGDVARTAEHAEATIALAEKHDFSYLASGGRVYLGWALAHQGHARRGLEQIRLGLDAYQATGSVGALTTLFAMYAEVCVLTGQAHTASSVIADALAMVATTQERFCESELLRLDGVALQRQSALDATAKAEARFKQALFVAREQQAKAWELRAAISLASLWITRGKRKEACELLRPIYAWFDEGTSTGDCKAAKRLLDEIDINHADAELW